LKKSRDTGIENGILIADGEDYLAIQCEGNRNTAL